MRVTYNKFRKLLFDKKRTYLDTREQIELSLCTMSKLGYNELASIPIL